MSKARILVVDDMPDNIYLMSGILSENGYTPLIANSGAECFEILENDLPDIILMDIMMPEMTGIEALEKIRQNQQFKNIPVIMVTAKTNSQDLEEALGKGAVDYVKKPFDEIELIARIKSALRLKESEDHLLEMIQTQESFIRLVSHDLRSPFTTIHGFAELLLDDDNLEESQKRALKFIIDSTNQSLEYFNKLLDWSRMGASEINLNIEEFSVIKILEYTIVLFTQKAKEKNIELILKVDSDLRINADEVYLSQVVTNLVSNAIKFTPESGKVSLSATLIDSIPTITISDNGMGIPSNSLKEIFKKSINNSRNGTKGEKGTGIGLSICKKIIDAHNFTIAVKSEENQYTEFKLQCK